MLLQSSIAALSILSFTSHVFALSSGHARLHHHPAAPRSEAPSVDIPLNMLHLLRAETTAFQQWMAAWLDAANTPGSSPAVALLKQEIQAYEGWMTAWLNAATSDNAPTAIPLPPSIPATVLPLSARPQQAHSTSSIKPSLSTSKSNAKAISSVRTSSSATAQPQEFLQLSLSVAVLGSSTAPSVKPVHTSFLTVTSKKLAGSPSSIRSSLPVSIPSLAPSPAPLSSKPNPFTVTPIIAAPSKRPTAIASNAAGNPPKSGGPIRFNALSDQNLAVYYGQSPATAQTRLEDLCQNKNVDIVILAFLTEFFGPGGLPKLNFGAACGGQTPEMKSAGASGLLSCPDLASQISQCQRLGKKVLLSLGGSLAVSAFTSDAQASQFATTLWNLFGAGTGTNSGLRPFGQVRIDGFDVDNEDHSTAHYSTFVSSLRFNMNADSSKTYYISAAPQCPRPDASIPLDAMQAMDFIFVQFYNNEAANCNVGQPGFIDSLKAWSDDLAAQGAGPRLYVGAPGCPNCAGSGYMDATSMASVMADVKKAGLPNLGGSMLWDGSEAQFNVDGSKDFLTVAKDSLR